jgi:hypothetical protein
MGNSPLFDAPELFDPARIRLTDIDGSGPIDLIYIGRDGARLYFNRGGNRFSDALTVSLPPATHNLPAVQVADLLGKGTACLVWNSHLPADAERPVRYIDLMGEKPHLLVRVHNNLGATTEIAYAPSTRFYLQPAGRNAVGHAAAVPGALREFADGQRQVARHAFQQQLQLPPRPLRRCRTGVPRLRTRRAGRHSVVREHRRRQPRQPFRDGRQAAVPAAGEDGLVVPHRRRGRPRAQPQSIRAGIFPARHAAAFAAAGYAEPPIALPVVDAGAGPALSADEWREAMRACKGMPLRQEVYELDFDALQSRGEHRPLRIFAATQHGCHLMRMQPRGAQRHAVFLVTLGESFICHYEADLTQAALEPDPRVSHTFPLRVDALGRAHQSVDVVYPRRLDFSDDGLSVDQVRLIKDVQRERHITYTETRYTDELPPDPWSYRVSLPCEARTYELTGDHPATGFVPRQGPYFSAADFRAFEISDRLPAPGAKPVGSTDYHRQPADDSARKRLVEHTRTLYFDAGQRGRAPVVAAALRQARCACAQVRGLQAGADRCAAGRGVRDAAAGRSRTRTHCVVAAG